MAALGQSSGLEIPVHTLDVKIERAGAVRTEHDLPAIRSPYRPDVLAASGQALGTVAHEVKDLARETTQATKRIEVQIDEMQTYTREAVAMIGEIVDLMESAHTINGSIAQAVEDQTGTTSRVSESTSDTRKMIEEVTQNIGDSSRVATEVASKAAELARGVSEISAGAAQTSEGAKEISDYIDTVRESAVASSADSNQVRMRSQELAELATQLKTLVDQFSV